MWSCELCYFCFFDAQKLKSAVPCCLLYHLITSMFGPNIYLMCQKIFQLLFSLSLSFHSLAREREKRGHKDRVMCDVSATINWLQFDNYSDQRGVSQITNDEQKKRNRKCENSMWRHKPFVNICVGINANRHMILWLGTPENDPILQLRLCFFFFCSI